MLVFLMQCFLLFALLVMTLHYINKYEQEKEKNKKLRDKISHLITYYTGFKAD